MQALHSEAMAVEARIQDISKRLARELTQAKVQINEDRAKLSRDLEAERKGLVDELEARQYQVEEERGALGHERARMNIMTARADDEVLVLNVGGQLFSTQRSTLCLYEGSYLANLFSGRWEAGIERDAGGNYFLDFDPASFRLVLNFLRSKRLECTNAPIPPPVVPPDKEDHFRNLVEYLGLSHHLRDAAEAAKVRGSRSQPPSSSSSGGLSSGILQTASSFFNIFGGSSELAGSNSSAPAASPRVMSGIPGAGAAAAVAAGIATGSTSSGPRSASSFAPNVSSAQPLGGTFVGGSSSSLSSTQAAPSYTNAASSAPHPSTWPVLPQQSTGNASGSHAGLSSREDTPLVKSPGWSKKVAHQRCEIDEDDPRHVYIADTRSLASAASVRSTRGFRAGRQWWEITVDLCSDWSYVGMVAEGWNGTSYCVGRSSNSWGIASNGAAFACREQVKQLEAFCDGSCIGFVVDLDARTAAVVINGTRYENVFTELPSLVFPAVSNCRSPARHIRRCK